MTTTTKPQTKIIKDNVGIYKGLTLHQTIAFPDGLYSVDSISVSNYGTTEIVVKPLKAPWEYEPVDLAW